MLGHLLPGNHGFPHAPRGPVTDIVLTLLEAQDPDGGWPGGPTPLAAQAMALMALEGTTTGSQCDDQWEDCSTLRTGMDGIDWWDSCPEVPNPERTDADGDGVGDECDLCVGDDPVPLLRGDPGAACEPRADAGLPDLGAPDAQEDARPSDADRPDRSAPDTHWSDAEPPDAKAPDIPPEQAETSRTLPADCRALPGAPADLSWLIPTCLALHRTRRRVNSRRQ